MWWCPIHECESEINHYTGHHVPYSLPRCVGSLTSHRFITCTRAFETGPTVYRPYPRRLESQTVCRCYPKAALYPQLFKDPECCSGRGLNLRPSAQQTGAYPIELTGRRFWNSGRTIIISPKYFEGFFKKKLFYYVGRRLKSKTLTGVMGWFE